MNLWDLKLNEIGTILSIDGSSPSADRLKSLGFEAGQEAQYLHKTALNGPRVFRLNETIYSLSFSVASQINVTTNSGSKSHINSNPEHPLERNTHE